MGAKSADHSAGNPSGSSRYAEQREKELMDQSLDNWPARTDAPILENGNVHVWRASLVLPPDKLQQLHAWLSPDEQQRAARMRIGRVRERFVASRGRQREILAAYLSRSPKDVSFEYENLGKPRLAPSATEDRLFFNLSNSHELALIAVSRDRELGVDVEFVDRRSDNEAIANRFFAEREKRALAAAPCGERKVRFFRCWTRKEAVLKALGVGLTVSLDQIEVSATTDDCRVLDIDRDLSRPDDWTLFDLVPAERYVAAVAFQEGPATVSTYAWAAEP
jgi:4'-phosphopantetheinyl transferase